MKKIKVVEMNAVRSPQNISKDRIRNEDIKDRMVIEGKIDEDICTIKVIRTFCNIGTCIIFLIVNINS